MKSCNQTGFTLIELMITVSLVAILATIAIPSFVNAIQDNRATVFVNRFVSSLHTARSEAVRRGNNVMVCMSANNATCTDQNNWEQGWLVFSDDNGNGDFDPAAPDNETMILARPALSNGVTLRPTAAMLTITYNNRGFATLGATTFTLCDDRGAQFARGVMIAPTGRVSRTVDVNTPGDDIENDHNGNNLSCPS